MTITLEQAKANLKQAELDQQANDETKAQALKAIEDLESEQQFQKAIEDLKKQGELQQQEQKVLDSQTPEDRAKAQAELEHLESIRLAESLLSLATYELQQHIKVVEAQELKVKTLSKKLEKLNNIIK